MNNILPPDFDGVFRFTNFSDVDFVAKWNNIAYTFPALRTTPMIIPGATPEDVQYIRRKFAKDLAVREFGKSGKFKQLNDIPMGGTPAPYTEEVDLAPYIQKCLEPLPLAQAAMKVLPKDDESKYRKNQRGKNVTRVLDKDESLLADQGTEIE